MANAIKSTQQTDVSVLRFNPGQLVSGVVTG